VEHFRPRKLHTELTFAWANLFLSCDDLDHCGHHKDSKKAAPYDPANLLKPDEDKPLEHLFFSPTGLLDVCQNASPVGRRRAEETIRVFNLNEGALKAKRRRAVETLRKRIPKDFDDWDAELRTQFLQEELTSAIAAPFSATLTDFLNKALHG
jgi:hypothetical protein